MPSDASFEQRNGCGSVCVNSTTSSSNVNQVFQTNVNQVLQTWAVATRSAVRVFGPLAESLDGVSRAANTLVGGSRLRPPNTYNEPMPTTTSSDRLLLARQAAALRDAGLTYDQIAARLAVSPHRVRRLIRDGQAQRLVTFMDRSFGVEIEHTGASRHSSAARMRDLGLLAEARDYTHTVMAQWKIITDASCGNEAVSPVLRGADGFEQVVKAMQAIRETGGSVNSQCGLHVHFDMSDLDGEQIARFLELYVSAQAVLNALVPPTRRHNGYCQAWGPRELSEATEQFRTSRSIRGYFDRYRTVNVMSFPKYGTIEVRQHQGTLNAAKIEGWIKLQMALIEIAKTDRVSEVDLSSVESFINSVCSIVGMPAVIRTRLLRRAESYGAVLAGTTV